jgi:hypothetical protein
MKKTDECDKYETNLLAISQKLQVQNDLRADVAQHKDMTEQSEKMRALLQEQMKQMSEKHND